MLLRCGGGVEVKKRLEIFEVLFAADFSHTAAKRGGDIRSNFSKNLQHNFYRLDKAGSVLVCGLINLVHSIFPFAP